MSTEYLKSHYYFVDEAGTPEIWGRRRRDILIGKGSSKYFIIGLADIREVSVVAKALNQLRSNLLRDPKYSSIASMQPQKHKTAQQFHAKDDHPEVRHRVFSLLGDKAYDIRFYAVIRHKQTVLESIQRMESIDSSYRFNPNRLYDGVVRRLFSGRLHFDHSRYSVYFSRRGKTDRRKALTDALHSAQRDYAQYADISETESPIRFISGYPREYEGLQIVDYFLWALQRLYERGENRYWKKLWEKGKIRCVVDLDDTSRRREGEIYSQDNPLLGELRISGA